MKSRRFVSIVTLCVAISAVCGAEPVALEKEFLSPPDSAKPLTGWHWLDGTITKDGITADLEGMKRAGLGGPRVSAMTWSARCSAVRGTSHRQRSTQ
jgi:hypothetical protein